MPDFAQHEHGILHLCSFKGQCCVLAAQVTEHTLRDIRLWVAFGANGPLTHGLLSTFFAGFSVSFWFQSTRQSKGLCFLEHHLGVSFCEADTIFEVEQAGLVLRSPSKKMAF